MGPEPEAILPVEPLPGLAIPWIASPPESLNQANSVRGTATALFHKYRRLYCPVGRTFRTSVRLAVLKHRTKRTAVRTPNCVPHQCISNHARTSTILPCHASVSVHDS
jgi:hypothetical protein